MTMGARTGGALALVCFLLASGCGRTPPGEARQPGPQPTCSAGTVLYLYRASEHDDLQLRSACTDGSVRGSLSLPGGAHRMAKMNRIIRHWQLTEVERPWTRPMVPAVIRLPRQRFL